MGGSAGNESLSLKLDHALIDLASPPITSPGGVEVSFTFNSFRSGATDKGLIFLIGAASMAFSAIAWRSVASKNRAIVGTTVEVRSH